MARQLVQAGPEVVEHTKIHQPTSQSQALVEIHSSAAWVLAQAVAAAVVLEVLVSQVTLLVTVLLVELVQQIQLQVHLLITVAAAAPQSMEALLGLVSAD
jgi:hypothetical protein